MLGRFLQVGIAGFGTSQATILDARVRRSDDLTVGNDKETFARAMRGVRRLKYEERASHRRSRPATAAMTRTARQEVLRESLLGSDDGPDALEQLGEEMSYRRASLPERAFRRLRRGQFRIEDEADLHGLTATQARMQLRVFIVESAARGLGCVRVIHGKGLRSGPRGPVLKTNVQRWLAQWDEVLAFVSARARDGGSGAVYVLLRRRR